MEQRRRNVLVTTAVAVLVMAAGTLGGSLSASAEQSPGSSSPSATRSGDAMGQDATQGMLHHGRHCHHGDGGRGGARPAPDSGGSSGRDFSY